MSAGRMGTGWHDLRPTALRNSGRDEYVRAPATPRACHCPYPCSGLDLKAKRADPDSPSAERRWHADLRRRTLTCERLTYILRSRS